MHHHQSEQSEESEESKAPHDSQTERTLLLCRLLAASVITLSAAAAVTLVGSGWPRPTVGQHFTHTRIDLNTADASELALLPGIGRVTARRIADHRAAHGPFRHLHALDAITGIGPVKLRDLEPWAVVNPPRPLGEEP